MVLREGVDLGDTAHGQCRADQAEGDDAEDREERCGGADEKGSHLSREESADDTDPTPDSSP
ncbi:MAG: hypothetical protein R6W83_01870, partial [Cryobacterium sp.]